MSCAILVWGFKRLISTVHSVNNQVVNKVIIMWHIIAYFFFVVANIAQIILFSFGLTDTAYGITCCC